MTTEISQPKDIAVKSAAPFEPENWNAFLKLLGLMIVANGQTLDVKVDTFLNAVVELRTLIDPTNFLSQKVARGWFMQNKPALEKIINNKDHDPFIGEVLFPIQHTSYQVDVVACMVRISVSDGKYAQVEKDMINMTCMYWQSPDQLSRFHPPKYQDEFLNLKF